MHYNSRLTITKHKVFVDGERKIDIFSRYFLSLQSVLRLMHEINQLSKSSYSIYNAEQKKFGSMVVTHFF